MYTHASARIEIKMLAHMIVEAVKSRIQSRQTIRLEICGGIDVAAKVPRQSTGRIGSSSGEVRLFS